jgi:hypothetical protein
MKDGSLATAVSTLRPPPPAANPRPDSLPFEEYHERILSNTSTKIAKKWIEPANHHFVGRTHEDSARLVADLYGLGSNSVKVIGVQLGDNDTEIATGMIGTLPADPAARVKIFAWYRSLKRTIEQINMPPQTDVGQKYITIEFKE